MAYFTAMTGEILLPTIPSLLIERNSPFIHRDLSWLQFNERVLAEAHSTSNPLFERIKFLAITSSNLDEFFMIRFSSLSRSILNARKQDTRLERRLLRIRANILEAVTRFGIQQIETLDLLASELEQKNILLIRRPEAGKFHYEIGRKIFSESVLPHLGAPEGFNLAQLSSLQNTQLAAIFEPSIWFRIPKNLSPVFFHTNEHTGELLVFFLEDLLHSHLANAFRFANQPGILRLTRDADFSLDLGDEDSESIPDMVRSNVGIRDKGKPVRFQWTGNLSQNLLQKIRHYYRMVPDQVQPSQAVIAYHGLWQLRPTEAQQNNPELCYPQLQPFLPPAFAQPSGIFDRIKSEDFLFHHPYDSFDAFVSFIKEACEDEKVQMIEQTVYRVDALSEVVDALKKAGKKKKIRVLIELRARFDELNNLRLAEELRAAGVEVSFGFGKLKLHAKIALVSRKEAEGVRLYTHLSTGNYNAMTARQYTDLAILTAHPEIGSDARKFFDAVSVGKLPSGFKHLVSAPAQLHRKLMSLIDDETTAARNGQKGRIVAKVNALVDSTLVTKLYEASKAGVQVDLLVRGACSLIPGVRGLSDNIHVTSIVDRFLEHSRIYYFSESKALYLSSADWMPRNFFSRLELAFPILNDRLYRYIENYLIPGYLLDRVKARELSPQGVWNRSLSRSVLNADTLSPFLSEQGSRLSAQSLFRTMAERQYEGTLLSRKERVKLVSLETYVKNE